MATAAEVKIERSKLDQLCINSIVRYRDSVLPPAVRRRLAIDAAAPLSWYRWVGLDGDVVGMTSFGTSAPYQDAMRHFGFIVENVVERALKLIG